MGLVFGIGPCTITCLPFLGPIFLARSGGMKQSWRTIMPFSLGRLTGYTSLGTASGLLGNIIQQYINTPVIPWLLGGGAILVGLLIFARTFSGRGKSCGSHHTRPTSSAGSSLFPSGLYFMGLGMALTPCGPLGTIMMTAAITASGVEGFILGLVFGIGAVIVPALVFGIGMAYFGQRIREIMHESRTSLERASAVLLIFMGISTAMG